MNYNDAISLKKHVATQYKKLFKSRVFHLKVAQYHQQHIAQLDKVIAGKQRQLEALTMTIKKLEGAQI